MTQPIDSGTSTLSFELPGSGHALFTTRARGNFSSAGGLDREHGFDTRERLRAQLGLRRLARGYQVHGTTVVRIRTDADIATPDSPTGQPPVEADGHATSMAGIGAMVLAADCLPVALGSERAVTIVHAGWRGLAAGVLEEGVRALRELGDAGDVAAIIGPGAGPCCYEVGEEVHAAFAGAHRSGRHIDLKALARDRLHAAGVGKVRDVEAARSATSASSPIGANMPSRAAKREWRGSADLRSDCRADQAEPRTGARAGLRRRSPGRQGPERGRDPRRDQVRAQRGSSHPRRRRHPARGGEPRAGSRRPRRRPRRAVRVGLHRRAAVAPGPHDPAARAPDPLRRVHLGAARARAPPRARPTRAARS